MLKHIFRIREFLQRGIAVSGDAAELLDLLGTAVDASAVALATPVAWGGFNLSEGIPAGWPNAYMAVRQWDPLIQRVCNPTVSTWVRGNEDVAHLHQDNPCAEAFFQQGFVDCLGLRVHNPHGTDHCFALYRESGKAKFTTNERGAMDLLVPHLCTALRTPTAQLVLRGDSHLPEFLKRTVVLRYPHRTTEWSVEARELIRRAVPGLHDSAWPRLDEVLFRAARQFYLKPTQSAVPIVGAIRADFAAARSDARSTSLVAILSEPSRKNSVKFGSRLFEELLSPRERRIARALAQGDSLEDAAVLCRITRETAKSHLKGLYRKLGIRSRAELSLLYTD